MTGAELVEELYVLALYDLIKKLVQVKTGTVGGPPFNTYLFRRADVNVISITCIDK